MDKEELKKIVGDYIDMARSDKIIYYTHEDTYRSLSENGAQLYRISGRKELFLKIIIDD